ncbi:MAG: trehalase family glycosidase, partial [Candidatus Omnitrophota bacterium]
YEPTNERIITPVSRSWSGGGFVLFEWDTYFACYMLSLDNKELAYANLIAITKEITPSGFVPNFTSDKTKSVDRSQPPVGSMVLKEVYKHHKDKWILNMLFDDFLTWNRWWPKNRDYDGYLCWGSDPIPLGPKASNLDKRATGKMLGAKFESGLDDSPMYDKIPFDSIRHMMKLADVGLMSMYIMDCNSLAEIARILNKPVIEKELLERGKKYGDKLETLWDEKEGIYLNKNLETGELDHHKSPTLFYPLLAKVPDQKKAERMMNEHFFNPDEFWGEWIMPSAARNDPAYSNTYWRGRVWGPLNFLVYLGMRNYDLAKARNDMTLKSNKLLLKMWQEKRLVHENYNPFTGEGTSDDFYHWGALLGFMKFIENGTVKGPEKPL